MVEIVEVCESIEKHLMQQCVIKCRELCNECNENDCNNLCEESLWFYDECVDYMVMLFHADLDEDEESDELDDEDEEEDEDWD